MKAAGAVRRDLAKGVGVEEGSQHSPRLRGNPDLAEGGLPDDAGLNVNPATALGLSESFQGWQGVLGLKRPQPGSVQEEAGGIVLLGDRGSV